MGDKYFRRRVFCQKYKIYIKMCTLLCITPPPLPVTITVPITKTLLTSFQITYYLYNTFVTLRNTNKILKHD